MRTNLVRGSECLRPAARGVVRRAARSALRRRALLQTRTQAEYLVLWFLALPARYYAPTTQQISALEPGAAGAFAVSPRTSPYLPVSPRSSSHLPASPRICPRICPYPAISRRGYRENFRPHQNAQAVALCGLMPRMHASPDCVVLRACVPQCEWPGPRLEARAPPESGHSAVPRPGSTSMAVTPPRGAHDKRWMFGIESLGR